MRNSVVVSIALAALAAGGLTACGSSSSDSNKQASASTTKDLGIKAGTGDRKDVATKAAEQSATAAGAAVKLPSKTIGILQIVGGQESADRLQKAAENSAAALGWKTVVCDGQGDPTKFATCAASLINRGVDAMTTIGVEPSTIAAQLKLAKSKNIPVVQGGGSVGPGYDGAFYPDTALGADGLAKAFMAKLGEVKSSKVELAVHDFPPAWARLRTTTIDKSVSGDPKFTVAAKATTDGADLVNFTRKTVGDQLTANPKLNGFWFSYDAAGQVGGQVVSSKFPGKKFPDKPLVATFDADLGTVTQMRKGYIDMIADNPYDAGQWVAFDQLAEYFGRKTPISSDAQPTYPGVGSIYDYAVVTPENMPPAGQYRTSKADFVTFFKTKWAKEFGAASAG